MEKVDCISHNPIIIFVFDWQINPIMLLHSPWPFSFLDKKSVRENIILPLFFKLNFDIHSMKWSYHSTRHSTLTGPSHQASWKSWQMNRKVISLCGPSSWWTGRRKRYIQLQLKLLVKSCCVYWETLHPSIGKQSHCHMQHSWEAYIVNTHSGDNVTIFTDNHNRIKQWDKWY